MSVPCSTCQPLPVPVGLGGDSDYLDVYSLQDEEFLWVAHCPPGQNCNNGMEVTLVDETKTIICCDGTEHSVFIPKGTLAIVRDAMIAGLVEECLRRQLAGFCTGQPPIVPPCVNGDPNCDSDCDPATDPDCIPPTDVYYSALQAASWSCADGSAFTYRVMPGRFMAFDQETANLAASNEAMLQVKRHLLCLGDLPLEWCKDVAFSKWIGLTGGGAAEATYQWELVAGALPTGLTLKTGWQPGRATTLTGTPTVAGSFSFTIRARSTDGCYMDRTYALCIVGISSNPAGSDADHLPDAEQDVEYTPVTLEVPPCAESGPLRWTATGLPDGLSLDEETGVISGTPTEDGDFTVVVTVEAAP